MKPRKVSQTGVGISEYIQLEPDLAFTNYSFQLVFTGSATCTLETTIDDTSDPNFDPNTADWLPAFSTHRNLTANTYLTINSPCTGARLNVTSGTGTVVVILCQAGIG